MARPEGDSFKVTYKKALLILMNLGKYTNDHMASFYLRTPSGFNMIENDQTT